MSVAYDYHLHSSFSADSETPARLMAEQAVSLGLKGICFTEHLDLDCPPEGPDFTLDFSAYRSGIFALAEEYRGRLEIRFGLEFGIQPAHTEILPKLAAELPFDFIIASQHFVDGKDPYYPSYFEGREEYDCYAEFFREELRNLNAYSDFDTLGHMDYIVRYGPNRNRNYSYFKYKELIDPILLHLIDHGKCLELNTGGLKYGLGEPNPAIDILKRYRSLGGEQITVGSDAHAPQHLAFAFSQAEEILAECGFRYYTIFRNRKPEMIPLT